ncbi:MULTISPECIES: HEAT repeat domain-containing protein [unclassified Fusibacter]|uniref:HEAT repeat domain-containing protein n=1 Tax=unclassified Fusibacter TaxID=2624464 RepID=UPI001011DEEA|nr:MULTISPECIES: hypothetical protein [unclassified Fusibacter]MCK8058529.1 hypothetical protein [Fusibacter sp. A2]NPE22702.1 hypothetical protein [Fusibacter sp. A1]RXV60262.1 hypothetical protein DWB64_12695 [Fusibacter sp. A1]
MTDVNKDFANKSKFELSELMNLIQGLMILEKNTGMYPEGHSAIDSVSERLFVLLDEFFTRSPVISITAIKNRLIINDMELALKQAGLQEFALFLSQRGIHTLLLKKGLQAKELQSFYRLVLEVSPKTVLEEYPLVEEQIKSLEYVSISEMDLSVVSYDDDSTGSADMARADKTSLWERLIRGQLSQEQIANNYTHILDECYHRSKQGGQLVDKKKVFETISKMFPEFTSELKEVILSTSFEKLNGFSEEFELDEFINAISIEMTQAFLEHASRQNKEISPALIKLISAFSQTDKQKRKGAAKPGEEPSIHYKQIEKLFERELYEDYVPDEYGEILSDIRLGDSREIEIDKESFDAEGYIEALDSSYVNKRVVGAILKLIDGELDQQAFYDFVTDIAGMLQGFLHEAEYALLLHIHHVLHRHNIQSEDQNRSLAIAFVLNAYSELAFTSQLKADYQGLLKSKTFGAGFDELNELIVLSGKKNLTWLLDCFLEATTDIERQKVFDLVVNFGNSASIAALDKIGEVSDEQIPILLRVVEVGWDHAISARLRELLESHELEVRIAVIDLFLRHHDRYAITTLKELLDSKKMEEAVQALALIRACAINEMAPHLAEMIKVFYVSDDSLRLNRELLDTLASLKEIEVLPTLEKIARHNVSLTLKNLKKTQLHLYGTLKSYPRESIQSMLEYCLNVRDENIRTLCEQLNDKV